MDEQDNKTATLLDMNKQLINQLYTPMSYQEVKDTIMAKAQRVIGNVKDKYFLLLSNDKHDFTFFKVGNDGIYKDAGAAAKVLYECIWNRGDVLCIDPDMDGNENCVDIWIKYFGDDLPSFYKFFPCDAFVIETGE